MADTTNDSTSDSGKGRSMKEISSDIKDAGMDNTYPGGPADAGAPNKTDEDQGPDADTVVGGGPKKLTDEQMNQDPEAILHPEESDDLELPSEVDTALWNEAKQKVEKEQDIGPDDPRYFKEVQAIYQAMESKEPTQ